MHLTDITPSIFSGLGLKDAEDTFGFGESPHGRECLFLIDGLGAAALDIYGEHAPALSGLHFFASVETAFPSTTATSLTTLMTGELPGVHGMLGYTVRVPRSDGRILNSLKWDERVDPHIWQPIPTLFERAKLSGIQVSHVAAKRYENTGFTQAAFRGAQYRGANTLPEMIEKAVASLKKTPSFTYVYVNDLDVAGHTDGVGSEKWLAALRKVDHVAAALVAKLPRGTRIWVTADHGMVNVEEQIILGRENSLLDGISLIAGEPRARHLYLDDDHVGGAGPDDVAESWREFLGERVDIYTREQAIERRLLGDFVSEDSRDRMGDIIAISHGGLVLIDPARVDPELAMVGHHGAMSDAERLVPLGMKEVK